DQSGVSVELIKLVWFTMTFVLLCVSLPSLRAQPSDTQASDVNKSWTATTESQTSNTNPTRKSVLSTFSHKTPFTTGKDNCGYGARLRRIRPISSETRNFSIICETMEGKWRVTASRKSCSVSYV